MESPEYPAPDDIDRCTECGERIPIERLRRHAKTCSGQCTGARGRRKYREVNGERPDLPTGTIGAMHELLVAVDLMRRGFEVFRALSPAASCDLAVLWHGALLRVEVRTGTRTNSGEVRVPKSRDVPGRTDHYAVVLHGGEIHYVPPLPLAGEVGR